MHNVQQMLEDLIDGKKTVGASLNPLKGLDFPEGRPAAGGIISRWSGHMSHVTRNRAKKVRDIVIKERLKGIQPYNKFCSHIEPLINFNFSDKSIGFLPYRYYELFLCTKGMIDDIIIEEAKGERLVPRQVNNIRKIIDEISEMHSERMRFLACPPHLCYEPDDFKNFSLESALSPSSYFPNWKYFGQITSKNLRFKSEELGHHAAVHYNLEKIKGVFCVSVKYMAFSSKKYNCRDKLDIVYVLSEEPKKGGIYSAPKGDISHFEINLPIAHIAHGRLEKGLSLEADATYKEKEELHSTGYEFKKDYLTGEERYFRIFFNRHAKKEPAKLSERAMNYKEALNDFALVGGHFFEKAVNFAIANFDKLKGIYILKLS